MHHKIIFLIILNLLIPSLYAVTLPVTDQIKLMKLILPLEKNSYFKNQFQNYKTQLEKGFPKQNNILIQNFHDFGSHYQTVYAEASFQGSFYLISEKNTVVFKEDKMILTLQTPQKVVTFSEPITGEPFINIKT